MRPTRARRAVLVVAFVVIATAWAADRVVVEDWRSYPLGTRGIPGDWKEQTWGKPAYDLEIVADNGQPSCASGARVTIRRSVATSKVRSISTRRRQSSSGDGRS